MWEQGCFVVVEYIFLLLVVQLQGSRMEKYMWEQGCFVVVEYIFLLLVVQLQGSRMEKSHAIVMFWKKKMLNSFT